MLNKIFILIALFLIFNIFGYAEQITNTNYTSFIGKEFKFKDVADTKYKYKIANKSFKYNKYINKLFVFSDIKLDSNDNLIIYLYVTLDKDKNKHKQFKIKTNSKELLIQDIIIEQSDKNKLQKLNISNLDKNKQNITNKNNRNNNTYSNQNTNNKHHNNYKDQIKNKDEDYFGMSFLIMLIASVVIVIIILIIRENRIKKNIEQNRDLISTVTDINRGEDSELLLILWLLKGGIPSNCIFHDLYVNISHDKFSQVDLVLLSEVGIIVFEVKDYSGWIFGKGNQDNWTQVLNYGKDKYRFYNPIKQNISHINALRRSIHDNIPFYSVVVFFGDSELKDISFIPQNTFVTKYYRILDVIDSIISNNTKVEYKDKNRIEEILKQFVNNGNIEQNRIRHVHNINDMLGKYRIFH